MDLRGFEFLIFCMLCRCVISCVIGLNVFWIGWSNVKSLL